ncbi:T9SS type B sorting domain-containing protein [Aestuariibaculum sediminum]|uniref:T9SS type B sorting domain-containing protein n=1 Tax=Aestuariibaculum sediminum TaxID=2770637 RepID=A0A8J6PY25_9FLAO|nr:T9SS type B sorting domain-containing protein [Aestuariibaculum sediminum]MBD0830902.1 T9SS type B sorting domain-containing protein [Aestuariibaculum sediminum]
MSGCFKIKLLIGFLLFLNLIHGQGEGNIWYFGNQAGVDFNDGRPVALFDSRLVTGEGCATICSQNGAVLFYTDGRTVWNKNHKIMLNGTGLHGHESSANSAIIIPKPGFPNEYYIFTTDAIESDRYGLEYSEVDMTLDNGLGAVTENKNIPLAKTAFEGLSALINVNANQVWVVTKAYNSNKVLAFNVSTDGVNASPVVSNLSGANNYTGSYCIKFSPNGEKMAISGVASGTFLCDFDIYTGTVSNTVMLDLESYGVEFSPDSNLLYVTYKNFLWFGDIYQYDITEQNITAINESKTLVFDNSLNQYETQLTALQLAPDRKIYAANVDTEYLSVIHNPNVKGIGCNFERVGFSLEGKRSEAGLPQYIHAIDNTIFISYSGGCFGTDTNFYLKGSVDAITWDFGDANSGDENTSAELNPTHVFSGSGIYEVKALATIDSKQVELILSVEIYQPPNVTSNVELVQCDKDLDGISFFNLNQVIDKILPNQTDEIISFYETQDEAVLGINSIISATAYLNQVVGADVVWARVENQYQCYGLTQVNLIVTTSQIPDTFLKELRVCDDVLDGTGYDGIATFNLSPVLDEIRMLLPQGNDVDISFYRSELDALSEVNPITDFINYQNEAHPYREEIYVRVENKINNNCIGLGKYLVLEVESPPEYILESPQIVCSSSSTFALLLDPEELNANEGYDYQWTHEDGSLISSEPTITVTEPGTYFLTISNTSGLQCSRTSEIIVKKSQQAIIDINDVSVIDVSNNNSITINTSKLGLGVYEFALNDAETYQDYPVFENVKPGIHTVYIRDKIGCGISIVKVSVIGFPKYFTPNGDGLHDTWKIEGANGQFQAKSDVMIYDRYGRVLKQLRPESVGWDGTFNGMLLPADDYWFSVVLEDGRIFKGHFTLKH